MVLRGGGFRFPFHPTKISHSILSIFLIFVCSATLRLLLLIFLLPETLHRVSLSLSLPF